MKQTCSDPIFCHGGWEEPCESSFHACRRGFHPSPDAVLGLSSVRKCCYFYLCFKIIVGPRGTGPFFTNATFAALCKFVRCPQINFGQILGGRHIKSPISSTFSPSIFGICILSVFPFSGVMFWGQEGFRAMEYCDFGLESLFLMWVAGNGTDQALQWF